MVEKGELTDKSDDSDSPYKLSMTLPTATEFCALRNAAGLSPRKLHNVEIGLRHSIIGITIRKENQLVAIARLIGDGGTAFEVVDVAVLPAEQGHGLGKLLMRAMTAYLTDHVPVEADVTLQADVPADQLYQQFGFRQTAPASLGMIWHRPK